MKGFLSVVSLLLLLFIGNQAFGQEVVFISGWDSNAYQTKELGSSVGATVTIPLPGNAVQKLLVGYPAECIYAQLQARGLDKQHPVVIAHSWGGRVLCRILADHPEFVPAKVIFVGSPLGEIPGSPPSWLFANVIYRADIPSYVMTSNADETIPVSSATAFPGAKEIAILEGVGHTEYFADTKASAKIRSWVSDPERLALLSVR